jgi:hypothetical protein
MLARRSSSISTTNRLSELLSLTKVSSLGSPSAKSPYAHSAIEYSTSESPIALGKLGKAGGAASSGLRSKNLQRIRHLASEARVSMSPNFERHDLARFSKLWSKRWSYGSTEAGSAVGYGAGVTGWPFA